MTRALLPEGGAVRQDLSRHATDRSHQLLDLLALRVDVSGSERLRQPGDADVDHGRGRARRAQVGVLIKNADARERMERVDTLVARARRLSQATMRNIRQNLFFAFIYKALGVPIAAGILYLLVSPMIAAAAMAASSVSVITNALRPRAARI